jgi:hypothetical protein
VSGFYEPPPGTTSPFRKRLLQPQWEPVAAALGRPVPGILRELYREPSALLQGHFYLTRPDGTERAWIDLFYPLDEQALHPEGQALPAGAIAFADDEHGDPYFYIPDATPYGDGPVYVMGPSHGPTGVEPVAESLAEFLSRTRVFTH